MMDLDTLKWANENPEEFRKQRDRIELDNKISNLESQLAVLKAKRDEQAE